MPVAVTAKLAVLPATTCADTGCTLMTGAMAVALTVTVAVALVIVLDPESELTTVT